MFKGTINAGTPVVAEFSLDATSSGPALLFIAYSSANRSSSDSDAVAPGGSGKVSVSPNERGILRVLVDMSKESDNGRLEVVPVTPAEEIQGDTNWGYVVV